LPADPLTVVPNAVAGIPDWDSRHCATHTWVIHCRQTSVSSAEIEARIWTLYRGNRRPVARFARFLPAPAPSVAPNCMGGQGRIAARSPPRANVSLPPRLVPLRGTLPRRFTQRFDFRPTRAG